MKVGLLSREYPPDVYGGAGVHVDFLSRELRRLVDLRVHTWGASRDGAIGHVPAAELLEANPTLGTLSVDLAMAAALADVDVVHSHTWYANLGGFVASLLYDIPHVVTAHSLEPRRPWKREQLGGGYAVSCWAERTAIEAADAIIAVSRAMRADLLECYPDVDPARVHVVYNGIDSELYRPVAERSAWVARGIDLDRPTVVFVGRVTRQKGLPHLLRAATRFRPELQLVICAGAADTAELEREVAAAVATLRRDRTGVHWIPEVLPRPDLLQLLSGAIAFCCPSVYEPLGIVNLEAMACGTAVVASAVGGIPEVIEDGVTGLLVPYDPDDPVAFESGLAERVNALAVDPDRAAELGRAGRERAIGEFGWARIAEQTVRIYGRARDARATASR